MSLITTSGFILKRNHFKDADRIVVIFSKEFGKIYALGKFAKKSIKRNLNLLDYGLLLKLHLNSNKSGQYYFINKVELIEKICFFTSYYNYFLNQYINELILNIVYANEENVKIFNLILLFLKNLNEKDKLKNLSSLIILKIKLLKLIGYGLNLDKCCICNELLDSGNYSLENLGFICNRCKKGNYLEVCEGTLKVIKNIDEINFSKNINLSNKIINEIEIIFFSNLEKILANNNNLKLQNMYYFFKNGI